ncbi:MAG: energy-coupling factor transporter transmembrane protein EcfT [Lachnospiraceae bacterium]|nr:energy-coupling factor transporter transmembrane protein EcfT [Lachnospiraceae bacterium]
MLKDITLGQYYQAESPIHKLDPRVKLFATFAYIILLFACGNVYTYICSAICLLILIVLSKVPFRFIFRGVKSILVILFISVFFNIFFTPGRTVFEFYFIRITYEGLIKALFMGIRFMLIIFASSILTLTTTPNNLTDGLEKSLGFLKIFKIPVHDIAMMMSIALRFIPILMEETDKIIKAQTARGANFESGKLFARAKAMIPILIPLFISAFKRANDLAMAMDARCYRGGEGRTKMKPLKYRRADFAGYFFVAVYAGILIVNRIFMG